MVVAVPVVAAVVLAAAVLVLKSFLYRLSAVRMHLEIRCITIFKET
jgi:hypothetical protein